MRLKKKSNVPWMTDELLGYLQKHRDLHEIRRQYPDNHLISDCIQYYSSLIKSETLRARQTHIETRLRESQNPSKEMWKVVNEEIGLKTKSQNICLKDPLTNSDVSYKEVPNAFNSHFLNIATNYVINSDETLSQQYVCKHLGGSDIPLFTLPFVTNDIMDRTVKSMLKTRGTADVYDMTLNIILSIWPIISNILVVLVNNMFQTGTYPNVLKSTRVCPVYKGKGDRSDLNNYRPITIVPTISKLIESILSSYLMMHLESNELLTENQYAYRQAKSTTMAANKIIDCIITGLDERYKIAGILCDLSKAFDVISHQLLLSKLKHYGIEGSAHQLFASFLGDRKQVVKMSTNGKTLVSDAGQVCLGIPQGSAIGNTLFLLFINDLPSAITSGLSVLFADDTTVIVSAKSYEQLAMKIDEACGQLQTWFSSNGLLLNLSKSMVMIFSGRMTALPPSVTNGPMPLCNECKFLGFTLDSNLNWKCHVDQLCKRLSGAVFALKKLQPLISQNSLKSVYFSHFHSLMSYGTVIWGNSTDAKRVFLLQKRALRLLAGVKPRHPCKELFKTYRIMTHYSLYMFEVLMFVRTNIRTFKRVEVPGKQLRSTGRLRTVPRRMALSVKNPRVIGPTYYERLPAKLRTEPSDETFKRQLRIFLLEHPLYSVCEYMDIKYI